MDSDLPRDCHRYFIEEIIELPHPQAILAKRLLNLIGRISGHFRISGDTIGPSGVRALPLVVAAERSVHYFWDYLFLSSFFLPCHILFLQKGLSKGYEILHRVVSYKINKIWG